MTTLRDAIAHIRPGAEFITKNNNEIIWLDDKQTEPSQQEITEGFQLLQEEKQQREIARLELLHRLGITEKEAKLLIA